MFSYRSFMVSGLMFKSLIQFELLFYLTPFEMVCGKIYIQVDTNILGPTTNV